MAEFYKRIYIKAPIKYVFVVILFSILYLFQSFPAKAECIPNPTQSTNIAAGTYTSSQMFRIEAHAGDSIKVKIPQNADDLTMILYEPLFSDRVCETFRGNNIEGPGTKTLSEDFPYDGVWYISIFGFISVPGYQLEVTWTHANNNHAPIVALDYTPHKPTADDKVKFFATASDPDGDSITYKWTVDGVLAEYPSDTSTISILDNMHNVGEHTVKVEVADSKGKTATATVSYTIPRVWIKHWSGQVKLNGILLRLPTTPSDSLNANMVPLKFADIIETLPEDSGVEGMPPNFVLLRYSDGAKLKMRQGTKLQILASGVRVKSGYTWIRIYKEGWRFYAQTPNAICGPRGTIFEVIVDENENSTVNVFEGSVEFSDVSENNSVIVDTGETSTCNNNGIPSNPSPINNATLNRWYEDVDRDGIADAAEGFKDRGRSTDTDSDGLQDYLDPKTTHFKADNGSGDMVMQISTGALKGCATIDETTTLNSVNLPDNVDFKWGFIKFTVAELNPHGSVNINLRVPEALDLTSRFWKYEQNNYHQVANSSVNGQRIAFTLNDDNGDGVVSIVGAVGIPSGGPLNAPSLLKCKATSSTQIILGWKDNANNESGFKIERKTDACSSTNPWTQIATRPANATKHTIAGLSPNTTYAFRVRAYQASTNSTYSNCASAKTGDSGTPPAPSNLTAISISSKTVNLRWTDNSTNETGFRIYRRVGTGAWVLLATKRDNVKTFSDTTAFNNYFSTTYQYYIVSYNAYGNSPPTYTATVPYHPTDFTVEWGATAGTVNLTWTDQSYNETGFEIYRKTGDCSSANPWAKVATLGANRTTWTDKGLTANMYCYQIRSYTKTGFIPSYGYSLPPP